MKKKLVEPKAEAITRASRTKQKSLRLSPRTLQRRLAADGASFEQLLDAVRADLALYYLRESRLSVAAVAEILQFSETSALTRACRRWHSASPRAVRATT